MQQVLTQRAYHDTGNQAVAALVDPAAVSVLDVGCGCGDMAALLRARDPHKRIYGISASASEAAIASQQLEQCWVADLEAALPSAALEQQYDVLVFSHVLEHLREPQFLLKRLTPCLKPGGTCIIAVPNVMVWRQRWQFLRGRFEYQASGVMDETHLRFYSYETAARRLCSETPELRVLETSVTGSVPLWILRRHVFSQRMAASLDSWACHMWPNLFGGEILLRCRKDSQLSSV